MTSNVSNVMRPVEKFGKVAEDSSLVIVIFDSESCTFVFVSIFFSFSPAKVSINLVCFISGQRFCYNGS